MVNPKGSPIFRYTLSYLHVELRFSFSLVIWISHRSHHSKLLLSLLIWRHEEPKVAGWQSQFPVNGVIRVFSGESIAPSGAKTSSATEEKVAGTETQNFLGITKDTC